MNKYTHIFFNFIFLFVLISCGIGKRNDITFYKNACIYADTLYNQGKKIQAKAYLDSIYIANTGIPPEAMVERYNKKAIWSYYEAQDSFSSMYVDSIIYYIEKYHLEKKYPQIICNSYNAKGEKLCAQKNLDKAFEYYTHSLLIAINNNDSCEMSHPAYRLGMVSYQQHKYQEASDYFKKSIIALHHCKNNNQYFFIKEGETLTNIGLSQTKLGHYDSAMYYYNAAISFVKENRNNLAPANYIQMAMGVAYGNIAKVFIDLNRPDSAEKYLLKSIALNDTPGFERTDALYAYMQLAELYQKENKNTALSVVLDTISQRLKIIPIREIRLRWLNLKVWQNKPALLTTPAGDYVYKYMALKDSIDDEEKKLQQTDYGQLIKVKDAEYKIGILEKTNQLNRIYLVAAVSSVFVILGIIILVYSNYRKSKRNVAALTTLNNQINSQKQQLEDAMDLLRVSNNDKDRILHVVAHDLRNPVGAILSLIEIMKDEHDPAEQAEMLTLMQRAAAGSMTLISEILEFSNTKEIKTKEEKTIEDINDIVRSTVSLLSFKANEKHQQLVFTGWPSPLRVLTFPEKLTRVFSNLIANAIKFSDPGAPIEISVKQDGDYVIASVTDHGMGIPEKDKPYIFESFTSARKRGTSGEPSYGLGLSICKKIVESDNGIIWFESTEGKGSTFFVKLPAIS